MTSRPAGVRRHRDERDSQEQRRFLRPVARKKRRNWQEWAVLGDGSAAFNGIATVPALLAFAVLRGAPLLHADDVAILNATAPGDSRSLGWASSSTLSDLERTIDAWADRGVRERYRLGRVERAQLTACLGPALWTDGRALVLLAAHLGRSFVAFSDDYTNPDVARVADDAGVVPAPLAFLAEAANAPPMLGQMTPIAAVRRWCGAFWYAGLRRAFRAFGPIPEPRRAVLPSLVRETLARAVQDQALRIATVTWRRHGPQDLALASHARPRTFAVTGLTTPVQSGSFGRLVAVLAEQCVHLAVLPELMLDDDEVAALRDALAKAARRFPGLVIAGRAHRSASTGGRFVNTAVALDAAGNLLFEHEKLEPFTHPTLGPEDIVPRESGVYHFADTPIGRLAMNICRDIRSDVPMLLNRALGVSLLAVPAYSKELSFAAEEARVLGARQGAIVVAVNPLNSGEQGLEDAAHVYAPIRGRAASEGAVSTAEASAHVPADRDALVQVWEISLGAGRVATLVAHHRQAV